MEVCKNGINCKVLIIRLLCLCEILAKDLKYNIHNNKHRNQDEKTALNN